MLIIPDNKVWLMFTNSNLPFSWLIRCRNDSQWSHTLTVFPDETIIESSAMRGGVKPDTLENVKHRAKDWCIAEFDCKDPQAKYNFLKSQVGKKYDYEGLIGYAAHDRDFQNPINWFCSEIEETSFIVAGSGHYDDGRSMVSPEDVWVRRTRIIASSRGG